MLSITLSITFRIFIGKQRAAIKVAVQKVYILILANGPILEIEIQDKIHL
jgi:hypothetical protein